MTITVDLYRPTAFERDQASAVFGTLKPTLL